MNLLNKLAAVGLSTVLLAGLTACDKNKVSDNAIGINEIFLI